MPLFGRADALRSYPPEAPPWQAGQGEPERVALLTSRARRLERLAGLLSGFDIDLAAGLGVAEPSVLAGMLDTWSLTQWPAIARREWAFPEPFDAPSWADAKQASVYTLIVDVGVALGELVLRHRPGLAWAVDRYEAHAADGVKSFGRALLLDPTQPVESPAPAVYDAIAEAFMRYQSLALNDGAPGRFIEGMRPVLWDTHRHLFVDQAPPR
jgi:hypothetical protein